MMSRSIAHPGPQTPERFRAEECRAHPLLLRVKPGICVNEAIASAFAEQGFEGGYVRLKNVAMKQLNFVMPAASPDSAHAAWYSQTHSRPGAVIVDAGLHMGRKDGKPFLHCHGQWRGSDGTLSMGHLLPFESEFAEETEVEALGIDGAIFSAQQDEETNFPLFNPTSRKRKSVEDGTRAILCTVRPNTDLCTALETIGAQFELRDVDVNGIGSLVGADYEDGTVITAYASEVLIESGRISQAASGHHATVDISMVDLDNHVSGGRLVRGKNPVCVTFELLLTEQGAKA